MKLTILTAILVFISACSTFQQPPKPPILEFQYGCIYFLHPAIPNVVVEHCGSNEPKMY